MYVELHAQSAFSFLEGASVPEEMAAVCMEKDLPAMALLDRDGLYGSPRFHFGMKKAGLKAHIGTEITVSTERHGCAKDVQFEICNLQSKRRVQRGLENYKLQITNY